MRLERRTEEGHGSTANAPSPAPPFRSLYRPLDVACTLMCFPPSPPYRSHDRSPHRGPPRSAHGTGPFADGEKKGVPRRAAAAGRGGAAQRGAGRAPHRACQNAFVPFVPWPARYAPSGPAAGPVLRRAALLSRSSPLRLSTASASAGASAREPLGGSRAVWSLPQAPGTHQTRVFAPPPPRVRPPPAALRAPRRAPVVRRRKVLRRGACGVARSAERQAGCASRPSLRAIRTRLVPPPY
jgi:hypothetical protein